MLELLKRNPEILGIGVNENTAILVQNNTFEVIGDSYVTIYHSTFWSPYFDNIDTLKKGEEKFYFLGNGCKYDLKKRQVIVNIYLSHKSLDSTYSSEYVGKYQIEEKRYWFDAFIQNDTLFVQRTQGNIINDPIPIFPKEKDVFFDKDSTWWYYFQRDSTDQVNGMKRKENKLINDKIFRLHK